MRIRDFFVWAALGTGSISSIACGSFTSHVEAPESSALGRVVVYRNGIAYYERKASVENGKVILTVPSDKVDDFLKSLTIEDAVTRKPLPVAYPTAGANEDGKVDMAIQVQEPGVREVILTYITEAPAWKPSYRVVVDDKDKVKLQGWAVVDNTSGETWRKVKVGVGSSSALSFRFDLRSVRNVWRETLKADERFAVAPPTGGATHKEGAAQQVVLAALDDTSLPSPATDGYYEEEAKAEVVGRAATGMPAVASKGARAAAMPEAKPSRDQREKADRARSQAKDLAQQVNARGGEVILEAFAATGDEVGEAAEDKAHWLRNELIKNGVAPGRIKVEKKSTPGQRGVRIVQAEVAKADEPDSGEPVGESHFQSPTPVTVERGTSAMIAVLDDGAEGDVVYLYDAESERGNARFAFKAVRFVNPTDFTLETGPMTVYGEGRFIGEGLTEPIPPHATAVVPFALDRQVIVESEEDGRDRISKLVTLQRGVLRTEVQHERVTRLKLTSILREDTRVFLRHIVKKGWQIVKSPDIHERMGESHLFEIALKAGETKTVEIVEATPLVRTLDLRAPDAVELVSAYLQGKDADARFAEPMKKLLAIHTEMANTAQEIELERLKMEEYRVRVAELQEQILTLKNVPGSGPLLANLQGKLREMSDRLQKGTLGVVELEQKLMLARIRFQDGVSELRLEPPQTASATP
jgi:hypothetical protein